MERSGTSVGFFICYSCLGTTSAECAEHGGSCLNGDDAPRGRQLWSRSPGVENGWTMDDIQKPPASQEEQPPVSQDQVPTHLAVSSMSNSADMFNVLPSSLRDLDSVHAIPGLYTFGTILRVVLNGFLSRAQQYWFVKQYASLGGGGLVCWALPTQCISLSLAHFVQSVTVLVWKRSSILVSRAASSSLLWSCHLGCFAISVCLVTSAVNWEQMSILCRLYHLHLDSCLVFAFNLRLSQLTVRRSVAWVVLTITS